MINLNLSELQCIRRALGDFISSKENSVYDFSFYVDINKKINDEIYSKSNKTKKSLEQSLKDEISDLAQMRIELLQEESKIAKVRREVERQITLRHIQLLEAQ